MSENFTEKSCLTLRRENAPMIVYVFIQNRKITRPSKDQRFHASLGSKRLKFTINSTKSYLKNDLTNDIIFCLMKSKFGDLTNIYIMMSNGNRINLL